MSTTATTPSAPTVPAPTVREGPYAKTLIVAHRGIAGIIGGSVTLNNPESPGQLGAVVDLSEVALSQAAFDVLTKLNKEGGSFADVMCWNTTDGKACFGWCGGSKAIVNPEFTTGDRDYNPELLRTCIVPDEEAAPPEDFVAMVDANLPPDTSPT